MMFIDTHTHIYGEEFEGDIDATIGRAIAVGVDKLFLPNIDGNSIEPMLSLCTAYPDICYPMVGLHPTELGDNFNKTLDDMEELLKNDNSFIAIGEVGIDLYWDDSRKNEQIDVFKRQIEWSIAYDLPLMIHSRSAHKELINALLPYKDKGVRGVFHCFSGTTEEAKELLSLFPTFCLGIGGVVTFKKSTLPETIKDVVPLSRIVLETDSPYLAPAPNRGKRNESSYIPLIATKLAEIFEVSIEEVGEITSQTALSVFSKVMDKQ